MSPQYAPGETPILGRCVLCDAPVADDRQWVDLDSLLPRLWFCSAHSPLSFASPPPTSVRRFLRSHEGRWLYLIDGEIRALGFPPQQIEPPLLKHPDELRLEPHPR
jgi:hypothetical protein